MRDILVDLIRGDGTDHTHFNISIDLVSANEAISKYQVKPQDCIYMHGTKYFVKKVFMSEDGLYHFELFS